MPAQEHYLDYVIDFVARHSLKAVDGGWQWKFDRRIFEQFGGRGARPRRALPEQVDCRLALLRSEYGLVTPDIGASMYEQLGRVTPVIEIPEAGHHAMLDQPLLLADRPAHPAGRLGPLRAPSALRRAGAGTAAAQPSSRGERLLLGPGRG